MDNKRLNVFILSDNALVVNGLRHHLENRFFLDVNISGFYDSKNCLKKVDQNTHAVILDYFLDSKSCLPTLKCIQAINPKAKIIMHSSTEDVIMALESMFRSEPVYNTALRFGDKLVNQYR